VSWPPFTSTSNQRIQFTLQPPTILTNFRTTECGYWISTYEAAFTSTTFTPAL